jgi:hypothetical protein
LGGGARRTSEGIFRHYLASSINVITGVLEA